MAGGAPDPAPPGVRRRRLAAAGGAAALALAVVCFAALSWDVRSGDGVELEQAALSSTQRAELASVLRHKENREIQAAEARILARMAQQRPASQQQLLAQPPLPHWLPTPRRLAREFQQYAVKAQALDRHIRSIQHTIDEIGDPALSRFHHRLSALEKTAVHEPVQKPAVTVQRAPAPEDVQEAPAARQAAAKMSALEQQKAALERQVHADVVDNSRLQAEVYKEEGAAKEVDALEQQRGSLERQVHADVKDNTRMQTELYTEERTVATLSREVANDAWLKVDLSKAEGQVKQLKEQLRAADAKAVAQRHLAAKAKSSHAEAQQEFKSIAAEQKVVSKDVNNVVREMHDSAAHRRLAPASHTGPAKAQAPRSSRGYEGSTGYLTAGVAKGHDNDAMVAKAIKDSSPTLLAAERSKLEQEMQSIEKSQDEALKHIQHKLAVLHHKDGVDVHALIDAANKESPGTPVVQHAEDEAPTQALVAKPKPKPAVAGHQGAHAHAHAKPHAKPAQGQRGKGRLSEAAFKAVENLAREGPDDGQGAHHPHGDTVRQPAQAAVEHRSPGPEASGGKAAESASKLAADAKRAASKTAALVKVAAQAASKTAAANEASDKAVTAAKTGGHHAPAAAKKAGETAKAKAATAAPAAAPAKAVAKGASGAQTAAKPAASAVKKGAATAVQKGDKGSINPMAEINMALKAETLFNKIGDGHKKPAAKTGATAPHAAAAAAGATAKGGGAKKHAKASSKASKASAKETRSEINPLSIIDAAYAKAKQAHAVKVRAEEREKKAALRAAAAKKRAARRALAKLNTELHIHNAKPKPAAAAQAPRATKQVLTAAKPARHSSKPAAVAKKPVAAPRAEMDPLAVIEKALVQEKKTHVGGKTDEDTAAAKPKKGSLLDLFGKRVAGHVGTLMDKVHKSEGQGMGGKASKLDKEAHLHLKMDEVEKLAKELEKGKIQGSKKSVHTVHTARMEKEVDESAAPAQKQAKKAARRPKPTDGQLQEAKEKEAEKDLQVLYKKGLLQKHSPARVGAQGQGQGTHQARAGASDAESKKGVHYGLHSDKDMEAMADLENLHKVCVCSCVCVGVCVCGRVCVYHALSTCTHPQHRQVHAHSQRVGRTQR